MLNKLRLDQTRIYERALATLYMAEMIVGHLECREHSLSLGCEQGGIPHWDDIVIEHHDASFEHIQVKRQETNFDDRTSVRGHINQGPRTGQLQDLSPLDEAISAIANTFRTGAGVINGSTRRFTLGLPHPTVGIKRAVEVRNFQNFCLTCANPTTTVAGLEQLAANDPTTTHIFEWLTTWCGFSDWNHVLVAMRSLSIRTLGNEAELNTRAAEKLATHFTSPNNVCAGILHFIDDNTTYAGATTPRHLIHHLRGFLRPDCVTWTQYRRDTTAVPWAISGTHSDSGADIEPPDSVVSALWSNSGQQRVLRVAVPWTGANLPPISNALLRLALHLPPPAQALFRGVDTWRVGISNCIAGTVGLEQNDLVRLPWVNENEQLNSSDSRSIATHAEQLQEAEKLAISMDEKTWELICGSVSSEIEQISDPALLAAVESLWLIWRHDLSASPQNHSQFLTKMLHATAEGEAVLAELRVGPLTVDLLSEAIKLLLIVAAALGDGTARWDNLGQNRTLRTIALRHWGGPSGRTPGPRKLDEGGMVLLGKERADVVILSGYVGPPGEIEEESLAADSTLHDNFGMPRSPKLLVTNSRNVRNIIREGTLANIREYFQNEMREREETRARNINQHTVGVNNGN